MVLFVAWDINPNPGPNNSNVQNPERNTHGTATGINLPEMELTLVNGTLTT